MIIFKKTIKLILLFSISLTTHCSAQSLGYIRNYLYNKLKTEKDSCAIYIDKLKVIAEERNDDFVRASYFQNLGQWEHFYGSKPKAKEALLQAKHFIDPLMRKPKFDTVRCEIHYCLADQHSVAGDAAEAVAISKMAVDVCQVIRETVHFANATYGASINHLNIGDYAAALYYMSLTYEHDLQRADSGMIAADLNSMGKIAAKMYDYDAANRYIKSSINFIPKKNKNEKYVKKRLVVRSRNIGSNYFNTDKLDSAYIFYRASLVDAIAINDSMELAQCHLVLSQLFHRSDSIDAALYHAKRGLDFLNNKNERIRQTLLLAKAGALRSNPSLALEQIQSVLAYAEKNKDKSLATFATQYSATAKERQKDYKGALADTKKSQKLKEERMATAQRYTQDNLRFNSEILQKNHEVAVLEKQKAFEQQRNELLITRALAIGLIVAAVIGGLLMFLRYRNKRKLLAMENLQLKKEKEFAFRINELEAETFRAQMNPHFMFNSLNSINHFILANEPRIASKYLTKFAALMRIVLNHSKEKLVPLKDEIEAMKLYLELEKLRSQEGFDYSIELSSPNLIAQIPPMLIQPYLENAIWHGVMPLKNKKGQIKLRIFDEDEKIKITIEDNGIGRNAAQQLKTKSNLPDRQSKALSINKKRLELITKYYGIDANVSITDLYEEASPSGTLVELSMPLILAA